MRVGSPRPRNRNGRMIGARGGYFLGHARPAPRTARVLWREVNPTSKGTRGPARNPLSSPPVPQAGKRHGRRKEERRRGEGNEAHTSKVASPQGIDTSSGGPEKRGVPSHLGHPQAPASNKRDWEGGKLMIIHATREPVYRAPIALVQGRRAVRIQNARRVLPRTSV